MNMTNILFSVVIPTYHRNDLLARCLDCLASNVQTLAAEQYEVIVTDDGFQTTSKEMIKQDYPWVKWVAAQRKGPAANRNNGAKYAQGEWLVFTDDDCLPDPQWLEAYRDAMDNDSLALEGSIHPCGDISLDVDLAECPVNTKGGCFWSANIAIKRSLFESLGGFDPNHLIAAQEDQDLKIRVEALTNISFIPNAKVFHPIRIISLSKAINRIPSQSKNWAYYANKNKKELGYKNLYGIVVNGYFSQIRSLAMNLKMRKIQSAFLAVVFIVFGMPIIVFTLIKQNLANN